ncbi:Response regulator GacA [Croceitalea dokdonensis DOKDO 023]|uniref:Response regulator GacA n=1 Tax=Croceitalea dokdonensis DOKDO 023 TaxID=1300341 RepID=A0A0P7AY42_9FLAO|nr:response regulator [Croceitalea dokdonensis]KPM31262.1 Response regulator GacA [Croceitalea dokdonensis DOKDO 023]
MFEKILVVEDLDSIGFGIVQMLKQKTAAREVEQALYCDEAYLKFLRAQQTQQPFDLVITDLSFKRDHRKSQINSGNELVKTLKAKQPDLKAIVYSVEDRSMKVKSLIKKYNIDGYVVKGREGLKHLIKAMDAIANNQKYLAPEVSSFIDRKTVFELDEYDIELLRQLSLGLNQREISAFFQKKNIQPSGISSIEKKLNRLKLELNAKTVTQLVAMGKDFGWV